MAAAPFLVKAVGQTGKVAALGGAAAIGTAVLGGVSVAVAGALAIGQALIERDTEIKKEKIRAEGELEVEQVKADLTQKELQAEVELKKLSVEQAVAECEAGKDAAVAAVRLEAAKEQETVLREAEERHREDQETLAARAQAEADLLKAQNADQAAMLVFVQEQRINELNAHNNELKNIITSTNTMFGAVFTELTGIIGVQSAHITRLQADLRSRTPAAIEDTAADDVMIVQRGNEGAPSASGSSGSGGALM